MAWLVKVQLLDHPKDDSFLGFYDVITQPDAELYTFDLDWTLHLRSAYEVGREQGLLRASAVAELTEIDAFWRAHPDAFDAAFIDLIPRIDAATELAGWVEDEAGRPADADSGPSLVVAAVEGVVSGTLAPLFLWVTFPVIAAVVVETGGVEDPAGEIGVVGAVAGIGGSAGGASTAAPAGAGRRSAPRAALRRSRKAGARHSRPVASL